MTENDKALFRAFFVAYYMKNTKTMPGHIARGDSIDQIRWQIEQATSAAEDAYHAVNTAGRAVDEMRSGYGENSSEYLCAKKALVGGQRSTKA